MAKTKAATLDAEAFQKGKATDLYNAKKTRTVTGEQITSPVSGDDKLEQKLFQVKRGAIRQFDVIKAEQGPRSGPRLIAEALNLLFEKYGKPTISVP